MTTYEINWLRITVRTGDQTLNARLASRDLDSVAPDLHETNFHCFFYRGGIDG